MNKTILSLIFLIILFLILIFAKKSSETFQSLTDSQREDLRRIYYVDRVDPNEYDVDFFGPECLSKCIRQFGARLNFTNCEGYSNPIQWSEENPTKGYCYRANDMEFPFTCGEECQQKCGKDLNRQSDTNPDYTTYNPDIDFTDCEVVNNICVEKKLNMLRGGGCQITSSCKACIEKYQNNIDLMNNIVTQTIQEMEQNQCPI